MTTECLYIIDTFSLMFQVFHAIPAMTGTEGQPTNAVFGFTRDLLAVLDRQPTHLICALDSPEPGRRAEIYEAYKINRAEMPEDLRPQIPLLQELLAGFGIPALTCPHWEADDVIATVVTAAVARGMDVVIVSGDKDLRQLLGPQVRILNIRRGEFLDAAGLLAEWGVRPEQVIDYQSLVGDAVDNVPGVPKIGPRTARSLIEEFGTLDHILANSDKVSGKVVQKNLKEYAEQARISRELVRLRTDLTIPLDFDSARVSSPDRAALFRLFTRLGFRKYASMMRDGDSDAAEKAAPSSLQWTTDEASLGAALAALEQQRRVFLVLATTGRALPDRRLKTAALGDGTLPPVLVDCSGAEGARLADQLVRWIAGYTGELVTDHGRILLHVVLNAGHEIAASLFDTSVADYLLDSGARSHELAEIAERHTERNLLAGAATSEGTALRQRSMFDEPAREETAARDQAVLQLARLQTLVTVTGSLQDALQREGMTALYADVERPLIHVLARMEHAGIAVDAAELRRQSEKVGVEIGALTEKIFAEAGCHFNIDSPRQLGDILFEKLGLPVLKKTRTGPSTDQEVLEQLALIHPLPAMIIERRQLTKLRGTYLDTLPELVHPVTGHIHATFHQTVAATGRLSSSDPNLQNIPVRTPSGRQVRRAFHARRPDWLLVCADYSQIELRIMAHFSHDAALLDAFREGIDIHAAVAAEVFQVALDQVTTEQRRVAKAVNFGVIYGQSAFGLATALNIDKAEAAAFIDRYFARYHGVAEFCGRILEETQRTGFARTILNRRRAISGIRNTTGTLRNMPERTAINTVIQGSAADLIKIAMIQVDRRLTDSGLRAAMLLQIHDELVFEVHADDAPALFAIIVPAMQDALPLDVPLIVDVTAGPDWLNQNP